MPHLASGAPRTERARHMARVESLDALLAAHPDALRDYFLAGAPTDSTALAGERPGLILAVEPLSGAYLVTRPLVRALGRQRLLWQGKRFESGGTAGQDRVLGASSVRFRCEVESSLLDDEPALVLRYDDLGNSWPFTRMRLELRDVSSGVAIGPAYYEGAAGPRLLFWWGLETKR
jgi:hypothetical protein